jgi:hypothetical protein
MKLLSICLLAAAFLTFLSGCVTQYTDSQGYTSGQRRAQHSDYQPGR